MKPLSFPTFRKIWDNDLQVFKAVKISLDFFEYYTMFKNAIWNILTDDERRAF